jgi:hypothetical protein
MKSSELRQPTRIFKRPHSPARPSPLALCALAATLLLGLLAAAVPVLATPNGASEAGRLHSDLSRIAELVNREVRPPAQRLARSLPDDAKRLEALREPASTTQAQVGIALSELRQMGAIAILDPHYLPALVAAGRAHLAVSGQDPLTGTTVNPEYRGLEPELAENAAQLDSSATEAAALSSRVKRLTRSLAGAKRRARKLEREIRLLRAADAATARR